MGTSQSNRTRPNQHLPKLTRHILITTVGVLSLRAIGAAVAGPLSPTAFHERVMSIYDFQPHAIGKEAFPAKSAQLDEFWTFVKTNEKECLPLLRGELANTSNPSFFYYDAAKLLLSLSKERTDQQLALRSLPKVDLRDVQESDYLMTVHGLASTGFDSKEAAFRILAFPDFKAFIPQHSLTLGQDFSLIYMLFPMAEFSFVDELIQKLRTETNLRSQKSLLLALWYVATPASTAEIGRFVADPSASADAVKYGRDLQGRAVNSAVSAESELSLRAERQKVMQRPISDEALEEFDALTLRILSNK